MRQIRSSALVATLAILQPFHACVIAMGVEGPQEVQVLKTCGGEVALELRKHAPEAGFIAGAKSWEKLWKAYRSDERSQTSILRSI